MKRLIVISSLVIVFAFSIFWMNRDPKELFKANLHSSIGGLSGSSGIVLYQNASYEAWASGCFGGSSYEGEYFIASDTVYISNLEQMIRTLEIRNIGKDSILLFESCDTLIQKKFRFIIAEKKRQ